MKIEFKLLETIMHPETITTIAHEENRYGIYIAKNELIGEYEANKHLFMDKLIHFTSMLTSQHYFESNYWYKNYNYKNGYDYEKINDLLEDVKKQKNNGILLYISQCDCERDFTVKAI